MLLQQLAQLVVLLPDVVVFLPQRLAGFENLLQMHEPRFEAFPHPQSVFGKRVGQLLPVLGVLFAVSPVRLFVTMFQRVKHGSDLTERVYR